MKGVTYPAENVQKNHPPFQTGYTGAIHVSTENHCLSLKLEKKSQKSPFTISCSFTSLVESNETSLSLLDSSVIPLDIPLKMPLTDPTCFI